MMQANNGNPENTTDNVANVNQDIQERLWLDSNLTKFDDVLRDNYDKSIEDFSEAIITYLCTLTEAMRGAFFVMNINKDRLEFRGGYACTENSMAKTSFEVGESVVGQVAKSHRSSYMKNIPFQNVYLDSSAGQLSAQSMAVVPLIFNEEVYGVVELIFLHNLDEKYLDLLNRLSKSAAAMLQSIQNNIKTKKLLKESILQAERLQAAEEEMRQNNEELVTTQEEMERKSNELERLLWESKSKEQEMHEVKEKLENEQENFSRMTSSVPGMIFQYQIYPNGTHKFPYTSSGIAEIFGKKVGAFDNIDVFKSLMHPEDVASFDDSIADAADMFRVWQWEGRFQLKNGEVKWLAGSARPEILEDESFLFSGIFTDITALKEKESMVQTVNERFQLINEGSTEGIWDMDIPANETLDKDTPVWWSGQCTTLLGCEDEGFPEKLGSLYDRVHPTSRGLFFEHFHHHLRNYESTKPFEKSFRFRTHNDRYRWFMLRGTIQRNEDGKPLRMAGALVDITAYKTLQKKLDKFKAREQNMLAKINEQEALEAKIAELEKANAELLAKPKTSTGGRTRKK
jgi:PAS domain-containing protein